MSEGRTAVPYDARWAELAAHECGRLATVSGAAEHVGTTALPGSPGRPVIDLLVGVRLLDRRSGFVLGALEAQGYERAPSRMPGALGLRKRGATDFDLYLVELGGREWKHALALRDYLRHHTDDARSYARALKEAQAAASATDDLAGYDAAKAGLIAMFGSRADQWRLSHPRA